MRPRTGSALVLATLSLLWLAAVLTSLHYRDLRWLRVLFIDVTWLQAVLLVVTGFGALMVIAGVLAPARTPPRPPRPWPFVSVVVPAKNEEAVIEATVRSLAALDYAQDGEPRSELIVVDDRSTDRTPAILERLGQELPIKVVRTPDGSVGKAAALNFGITRARGELIAVFDADARVAPGFLARMVPYFDAPRHAPRVGGVQSRRAVYNGGENLLTRIQDDEYRLFSRPLQRARGRLGGFVSFSGNGLIFRRETLDAVGGWNEEALTEDIDLSLRFHLAGWDIRYCEEAVVWEEAVPQLAALIRQRIRWFEGALRCLGDYLPAIVFSRTSVLRRVDMAFFLGGGLFVTLCLLTSYLYVLVDLVGAVVLYLQLPRRITTLASAALTAGLLCALVLETRGRLWRVGLALARAGLFSLHRLLVVPLAIHRYMHSAITGETSWEKTAHGTTLPARSHQERDL